MPFLRRPPLDGEPPCPSCSSERPDTCPSSRVRSCRSSYARLSRVASFASPVLLLLMCRGTVALGIGLGIDGPVGGPSGGPPPPPKQQPLPPSPPPPSRRHLTSDGGALPSPPPPAPMPDPVFITMNEKAFAGMIVAVVFGTIILTVVAVSVASR